MKHRHNIELLIDEHWEFIRGIFDNFPVDSDEALFGLQTLEYIYKMAFEHGYKHGSEPIKWLWLDENARFGNRNECQAFTTVANDDSKDEKDTP
jgi:hypothetical protein